MFLEQSVSQLLKGMQPHRSKVKLVLNKYRDRAGMESSVPTISPSRQAPFALNCTLIWTYSVLLSTVPVAET